MTAEGQVRWLLRRGMKELDVVTERYYAHCYPVASPAERECFVHLLQRTEDPDLWAWLMGYEETPTEFRDVIEQLRRHR